MLKILLSNGGSFKMVYLCLLACPRYKGTLSVGRDVLASWYFVNATVKKIDCNKRKGKGKGKKELITIRRTKKKCRWRFGEKSENECDVLGTRVHPG